MRRILVVIEVLQNIPNIRQVSNKCMACVLYCVPCFIIGLRCWGGGGARGKGVIVIFVIIVKLPLLRYYLGEPQVTPYLTHSSEICLAFTITYIYRTYLKNKTVLGKWFIRQLSV